MRMYMQLKKAANWAPIKANTILLSRIIVGLIGIVCSTSILANSQNTLIDVSDPGNTQQTSLIYALNNSSLSLKDEVIKLYQLRNYNLIWSNGEQYNANALELFEIIRHAGDFGLNPVDYDVNAIQYLLSSTINDTEHLNNSDITFTHAYIKLASHLEKGKYIGTSPVKNKEYSLIEILNEAIDNHAIAIALENLQPINPSHSKLVLALKKYRSLQDEYEPIVLNKRSFTIGDKSPEIIKLRKRLHAYGDYTGNDMHSDTLDLHSDVLDESIALAISNFQSRHGLEADGILGKNTAYEINRPITDRIHQLELNLERSRYLPEFSQDLHLIINIPEYQLYVNENGKTIYQSRVVVGKRKNKTPVFSSELTELILNPYWNVPNSITSEEIIPMIRQDPDYLTKHNMKVLGIFNNQTHEINPETVDWSSMDLTGTPLRIRQEPGAKNSLGRIKFNFPNAYNVYLHDTPVRSLFTHSQRAFSHGCIRVEDAFGLAEVLLANNNLWSKDDLYFLVNRSRTKTVKLDNPIPIHITYMTAWVDDQGVVNFRPDIYKRDRNFANSLYNAAN